MSILKQIFEEIKAPDESKLKIICDKIMKEENEDNDIKNYKGPIGSNILISLPSHQNQSTQFYLTLERAGIGEYDICEYRIKSNSTTLIKFQSSEIKDDRPEKILEKYAKKLKFLQDSN